MPVYAKIEDSIKDSIRQYTEKNIEGSWDDHYSFVSWAYHGFSMFEDPILHEVGLEYQKLVDVLHKNYPEVDSGELVKLLGEVIAENEYSYMKAWGAIEVYDTTPDFPDC